MGCANSKNTTTNHQRGRITRSPAGHFYNGFNLSAGTGMDPAYSNQETEIEIDL